MGNPSVNKRQKEQLRKEKQRDKDVKRQQRKDDRDKRAPGEEGIDPDIAGIVPGPQAPPSEE
jgi:hypothetical protein